MTGTYAGQFVMEGFLDFQLPIYQRVLLTRSIAIVPALCVTFLSPRLLTRLDTFLNILQSVQLPFALVPLIKFASSPLILKEFAISKCQFYASTTLGILLCLMNFYLIFSTTILTLWYEYIIIGAISLVYIGLIVMVMREPVKPLQELTREEDY